MAGALKKLWSKIRLEIIWRLLWLVSTAIAYTVRFTVEGGERFDNMLSSGRGGIIVLWHGKTMLPIFWCRGRGIWSIISPSADGELQDRIVRSRGYRTIRGSSGGNGVRAFLGAAKCIRDGGVVAITPDGPRGPANVVQLGTVLLAERSECDVMPIGVACRPVWRLNSWDRHMIPKPFARAVIYFGETIRVSACENDDDRRIQAEKLAELINECDRRAELLLDKKENGGIARDI